MVTCQSCNLAYDLVLVSNWFMQKDFEMQLAVVKVDGGGHPKPNRLVDVWFVSVKESFNRIWEGIKGCGR